MITTEADWHEVTKIAYYYLSVNAMQRPMDRTKCQPNKTWYILSPLTGA